MIEGARYDLHKHQSDAINIARSGASYILTTGTGSGKSLAYIIPIVDYVLRNGTGRGIQAIVVYPMNALANSQMKELEKFLRIGYPNNKVRSPLSVIRARNPMKTASALLQILPTSCSRTMSCSN